MHAIQRLDSIVGGFHHDMNILQTFDFKPNSPSLEAGKTCRPSDLIFEVVIYVFFFLGGERYWKTFQNDNCKLLGQTKYLNIDQTSHKSAVSLQSVCVCM